MEKINESERLQNEIIETKSFPKNMKLIFNMLSAVNLANFHNLFLFSKFFVSEQITISKSVICHRRLFVPQVFF